MLSGGRNGVTSTFKSSRSRTARWYSARLSRWKGRDPGSKLPSTAESTRISRSLTSAASAASSGRRAPAGGIIPARNLRIIFSVTSVWLLAFDTSKSTSESPPALPRSLWQPVQDLLDERRVFLGCERGGGWRRGANRSRRVPAASALRVRLGAVLVPPRPLARGLAAWPFARAARCSRRARPRPP